jgi:transcriptional regulator with XRE-family HTH domain
MTISLGERIAKTRQDVGLSAADLAKRMGVKKDTVEKWEAGRVEPRPNKLMQLAGILEVSLLWLMTGKAAEEESRAYGFDRVDSLKRKLERAQSLQGEVLRLLGEVDRDIAELKADGNRAA